MTCCIPGDFFCEDSFQYAPFTAQEMYYKEDSGMDPSCKMLWQSLRLSREGEWLKFHKPMISGQLFYTPNNALTQQVMRQVQEYFNDIKKQFDLIKKLLADYKIIEARFENFTRLMQPFKDFAQSKKEALRLFSNDSDATWRTLMLSFRKVMEKLNVYSSCFLINRVLGFASEEDMLSKGRAGLREGNVWAGIVFDNMRVGNALPKYVTYRLRMSSELMQDTRVELQNPWDYRPSLDVDKDLRHLYSGQDMLMDIVEKSIIKAQTGPLYVPTGIYVQSFPTPTHYMSDSSEAALYSMCYLLPIAFVFAYHITVACLIYDIVHEKGRGIKFYMSFFRVTDLLSWPAWFLSTFTILVIVSLVPYLFTCFMLPHTNISVIAFVFFSYIVVTIVFCFVISTFFYQDSLAAVMGVILYVSTLLPYFPLVSCEETIIKILLGLVFHNVTLGFICERLVFWDYYGAGATWRNMPFSPVLDETYHLVFGIMMLYLNGLLHLVIAVAVNKAYPGKHFLCPGVLVSCNRSALITDEFDFQSDDKDADPSAEAINEEMIKCHRVQFKFPMCNSSLNSGIYSFSCNKNEITCLLGYARTWKSCIVYAVCRLMAPYKGGVSLRNHPAKTRKSLYDHIGFCPQFDPLFCYLNIKRHFWFYGKLQGTDPIKSQIAGQTHLSQLRFLHNNRKMVFDLDDNDRRKLTIAISLLNDTEILILDQPTCEMDVIAQRDIWCFLKRIRNKTVMFTSCSSKEAIAVSDRIVAVSVNGVHCIGSPPFAVKILGNDPTLVLTRKEAPNVGIANENYLYKLDRYLSERYKELSLVHAEDMEVIYRIPRAAINGKKLAALFEDLAKDKEEMGLIDFAFHNIDHIDLSKTVVPAKDQDADNKSKALQRARSLADDGEVEAANTPTLTRGSLHRSQMRGLLVKNISSSINCQVLFAAIILPILFITIGILVFIFMTGPHWGTPKNIQLIPWRYGTRQTVTYANRAGQDPFSQKLLNAFRILPYYSTGCIKYKGESPLECQKHFDDDKVEISDDIPSKRRKRRQAQQDFGLCYLENGEPPPVCKSLGKVNSEALDNGDFFDNVTAFNMSEYILTTRIDQRLFRHYGVEFLGANNLFGYSYNNTKEFAKFLDSVLTNGSYLNRSALGIPPEFFRRNTSHFPAFVSPYSVVIWWDNKFHHMLPISINTINNVVLRAIKAAAPDVNEYAIAAYAHPWNPLFYEDEQVLYMYPNLLLLLFFIMEALAILPAYFFYVMAYEYLSGAKHLYFINGLVPTIYWTGNYIHHYVCFFIPATIVLMGLGCTTRLDYVIETIPIVLFYGLAVYPFLYLQVFLSYDSRISFYFMLVLMQLEGVGLTALNMYFQAHYPLAASILKPFFCIFPPYGLCAGILELHYTQFKQEKYEDTVGYFKIGTGGLFIMMLALDAFVYFIMLLIFENKVEARHSAYVQAFSKEDEESENDRLKLSTLRTEKFSNAIDVIKVRKEYKVSTCPRQDEIALDNLRFSVPNTTCVCMFGDIESGKTSTIDMIAAKTDITSGKIVLYGSDSKVFYRYTLNRQLVSFCPENTVALDPYLSARRLYKFIARVKGIENRNIPFILKWVSTILQLENIERKCVWKLSKDERRLVLFGASLIGNSRLYILDEPFTRLDPRIEAVIKDALRLLCRKGKSIFMTSPLCEGFESDYNSNIVDSAVVLSHKQTIMRGHRSNLMQDFASYVLLWVVFSTNAVFNFNLNLHTNFEQTRILERLPGQAVYRISKLSNFTVSNLFKFMEENLFNKRQIQQDDSGKIVLKYTISDPTLELLIYYAVLEGYEYMDDCKNPIVPMKGPPPNINLSQSNASLSGYDVGKVHNSAGASVGSDFPNDRTMPQSESFMGDVSVSDDKLLSADVSKTFNRSDNQGRISASGSRNLSASPSPRSVPEVKKDSVSRSSSKRNSASVSSMKRDSASVSSRKGDSASVSSMKRDSPSVSSMKRESRSVSSMKRESTSRASMKKDSATPSPAKKVSVVSPSTPDGKKDSVSKKSPKRASSVSPSPKKDSVRSAKSVKSATKTTDDTKKDSVPKKNEWGVQPVAVASPNPSGPVPSPTADNNQAKRKVKRRSTRLSKGIPKIEPTSPSPFSRSPRESSASKSAKRRATAPARVRGASNEIDQYSSSDLTESDN